MAEFRGPMAAQDWDLGVDDEAGELIVSMNGVVFLRAALPRSKWVALRLAAARVIEKAMAR